MVLVDTSVWIDFLKGKERAKPLNALIDSNNLCINNFILAELIPSINHKKEYEFRDLLESVRVVPIDIDWKSIIAMQTLNLKNGINNVGVADLVMVENALDQDLEIFAFDRHFALMNDLFAFKLYQPR